ncbi:MAG TPA: hypothetical protein ENN17_12235 [bacterium]|nr:hypothetical protein [bacterium]
MKPDQGAVFPPGFLAAVLDTRANAGEKAHLCVPETPFAVQTFLDGLAYSSDSFYRCPLRVLHDRKAHCFDGAMLAAALLWRIGHAPRILEMLPNRRDDDHMLALYRTDGHWGAVAKSNFTGLRFREPIFRTLRELVLSYFEQYFNQAGEKTLTGYTAPLDLRRFPAPDWLVRDETLDRIAEACDRLRRYRLITPGMAERLSPVDPRTLQAGLAGADETGLFQPPENK